jgi:glucose-1-phosphate cytidylyltransferase
VTFDFRNSNERIVHHHSAEPWSVTLVNTAGETMTGGRVKRVKDYIGAETFLLTYGLMV